MLSRFAKRLAVKTTRYSPRALSTLSPIIDKHKLGGRDIKRIMESPFSLWATTHLYHDTLGLESQIEQFSSQQMPPFMGGQQSSGEALAQYSTDLTAMAMDGKLDPVIGRHEEIRQTLQILARRTKNNPCLIGEAGEMS